MQCCSCSTFCNLKHANKHLEQNQHHFKDTIIESNVPVHLSGFILIVD